MRMTPNVLRCIRRIFGVVLIAMVCGHALTVNAQDRSEKLRRFELDSQACHSGITGQDLDACMKEAKAVFAAPVETTPAASAQQRKSAAVSRCDVFTDDVRTTCIARTTDEATVSGSVAGGGILRELVTPEVAPPDSKTPASAGAGK
jgi:hypothetical protein